MDQRNNNQPKPISGSPFRPDFVAANVDRSDESVLVDSPIEIVQASVISTVVDAKIVQPNASTGSATGANSDPSQEDVKNSQRPETGQVDRSSVGAPSTKSSWVFRCFKAVGTFASHLFGIASVIFLLAFAANVPILQLLSFGYLLEVSGRLGRKQSFRDAMIGLKKATVVGAILLGTWLTLWPIRLVSTFWIEAYLIDPNSAQTAMFRFLQIVLIAATILHIATAWVCGGKLRYFFWPIIAPFSFGVRLFKKGLNIAIVRRVLAVTLGWISPHLVDDICNVKPIGDWFLPAIVWRKIRHGNLYALARDAVWDFTASLNLPYYFTLGFKGVVGTLLWLLVPTSLLVLSSYTEGGAAIISGILGTLLAIPTFAMLPFVQTHFAKDGKLRRFKEIKPVFRNFGRAPVAHLIALLVTLVLALPLFLLKIEQIPPELLWTLSLVFVIFSWPARIVVGWAYRRGMKKEISSRWWVRYPLASLMLPVSLAFVIILTLTRYISWYGALSLFENHVFLLPAPFWL